MGDGVGESKTSARVERAQEWWEERSTMILRVGQGVLSITTGRRSSGDKETWWWNDKVQDVIKAMREARKMWETSGRQEGSYSYRQANKAAKKTVAMNELYEELETPEGERKISRIAKAKDFIKNNPIKDEQRVVLRDLDRIMGRWKGYFNKLLNGENNSFVFEDGEPNYGLSNRRNGVKVMLSRMKKGETIDMVGIPEDVWICLGKMGLKCMPSTGYV